MQDLDNLAPEPTPVEPFRVTPGFVAFVALACLPALAALVIFFGAWMVSSEVRAAEAAPAMVSSEPSQPQPEVEGWKKTLVGICPLH